MIYSLFTVPDPSLTQDSSVDPMGIEPIWIHYGQKIFRNRITSVTSDIRGFTINAFHHYVLDKFLLQEDALVRQARERHKGWSDRHEIKAGLLIMLEDLLTYIFYQASSDDKEVDQQGILGMLKANGQFRNGVGDFMLVASKRGGLLKNQINLGFTGRYRNPMNLMGFFDKNLGFVPNDTTRESQSLFDSWPEAQHLCDAIIIFLKKDLLNMQGKRKVFPDIALADLVSTRNRWQSLRDGYLKMFGTGRFPLKVRTFWQYKLGLEEGAAAAVFQCVDSFEINKPDYYKNVFVNALQQLKGDPAEAAKVEDILRIQPLLSHVEYLVRFMAHPFSPQLDKMKDTLLKMRSAIEQAARQIPDTAIPSLRNLQLAALSGSSLEDWLSSVFQYHKKVMERRKGTPWFEMDNSLKIRRFFSPSNIQGGSDMEGYLEMQPWLHTFYLPTLLSIKKGLK